VYPYTVEGLAEQEAAAAAPAAAEPGAGAGPADAAAPPAPPGTEPAPAAAPGPGSAAGPAGPAAGGRPTYIYQLKGIVVHSGTAFAGHYYSYIKARPLGHAGALRLQASSAACCASQRGEAR